MGRLRNQLLAVVCLGASLVAAAALLAPLGTAAQGAEEPGPGPECVDFRGEARYRGYGYDHVVILTSRCERTAQCRVATDVSPEQQSVEVPEGSTVEVLTRRGSPARAFEPQVSCTLP